MRKTPAPAAPGRAEQCLVSQDHPGEALGRPAVLVEPGEDGRACAGPPGVHGPASPSSGGEALQRLPGRHGHAGEPQQAQGRAAEYAVQPDVGGVLVEAAFGGQGQLRRGGSCAGRSTRPRIPGSRSWISW